MVPIRRWLAHGFAPPEVDTGRYRRIVRVLAIGRIVVVVLLVGVVLIEQETLSGGPGRFLSALGGLYAPFVLFQLWAAYRERNGPLLRAVIVAADAGVVALFAVLFPEIRILVPYGYLFVVAFSTAMGGLAAGFLASMIGLAGSLLAWPEALSGPVHRTGFWALVAATAIVIDGIGRERNEAARRATEREAELEEAQAVAHVGSWRWDLERDEVTCSDELFRIFGYDDVGLIGSFRDVILNVHPDDRVFVYEALTTAVREQDEFAYENRILHQESGKHRIVETRGRVVRDRLGTPVAALGTGRDVTAERQAEEAMRTAFEREREAAEHLRTLNEMKMTFLTAVSHELRTPLTVILGLAHTLSEADLPSEEDRADMFQRLVRNAEKLERLVADLLDIDRLERGILHPERRPTDVAGLVRTAVRELGIAAHHPLDLELTDEPFPVDPSKVERIVENLLANAAKHTSDGTPIHVRLSRESDGLLLDVSDEGPGVPSELRGAIFSPFRQGPSPSHSPGVGIGLSLVARFAELHGGRAWVEERPGGGASFRVLLPPSDDEARDIEIGPGERARPPDEHSPTPRDRLRT